MCSTESRLVDMAGVVLRPLEEWLSIVDEIDNKAEAGSVSEAHNVREHINSASHKKTQRNAVHIFWWTWRELY